VSGISLVAFQNNAHDPAVIQNHATGLPGDAVSAVVEAIGALQTIIIAAPVIGPDSPQRDGAVEQLQFLLPAGGPCDLNGDIAALQTLQPDPDQQADNNQQRE